jgi:hypothetical protein
MVSTRGILLGWALRDSALYQSCIDPVTDSWKSEVGLCDVYLPYQDSELPNIDALTISMEKTYDCKPLRTSVKPMESFFLVQ